MGSHTFTQKKKYIYKRKRHRLTNHAQATFKNIILRLSINPYALGKTGSNPNGTELQEINHLSPSANTQEWKTTDLRLEPFRLLVKGVQKAWGRKHPNLDVKIGTTGKTVFNPTHPILL